MSPSQNALNRKYTSIHTSHNLWGGFVLVYRVIKNQPPPVLSINLDHNPFKCSAPGCTKSFRKAKLLHYHMKYYHGDEHALEGERSPTRSVQTRASDKQVSGLAGPKRRRTISASMRMFPLFCLIYCPSVFLIIL